MMLVGDIGVILIWLFLKASKTRRRVLKYLSAEFPGLAELLQEFLAAASIKKERSQKPVLASQAQSWKSLAKRPIFRLLMGVPRKEFQIPKSISLNYPETNA